MLPAILTSPIPGVLSSGWTVLIGLGDADAIPGVAVYDTSLYDVTDVYGSDDPFGYLVDASAFVQSVQTVRGRDRFTSRFRTGSARIVLNNITGIFSPQSGQAPLGILPLSPGRAVKILYDEGDVWTGFVNDLRGIQSPDGNILMEVNCVDQFAQFQANNKLAVTAEGAGDSTYERMRRLLASFLPDEDYTFSKRGLSSAYTMLETTMAQNLLTLLQITAESEGGGCWMSAAGTVYASNNTWFQDQTLEPIKWTVGGTSGIELSGQTDERTLLRIINEAHYARVGGTEQVRTNAASIAQFKRRTHTRLDLINDSDVGVGELAENLVQFAGVDRLRLTSLVFQPEPESQAAYMCSTARMGDTVLATINTIFGWSYTIPTQIFGIEHTVNEDQWVCTLRVDDTLFQGEFFEFSREEFDNEEFA